MSDIKSLGYIKIQTNDIDRWRSSPSTCWDSPKGTGPDPSALYLRMDERAARIIVVPGDTDGSSPSAGRSATAPALQRGQGRRSTPRVSRSRSCPPAEADARRVEEVITFDDPAGTTLEVFHGAVLDHSPVVTPFGARFVTGDRVWAMWLLPAIDPNAACSTSTPRYSGFRSRGAFRRACPPEFGPVRVRFLGINERHHSLAICPGHAPAAIPV